MLNYQNTLQKIYEAEKQYTRLPHSVCLLAVSKTQSSKSIRKLWQYGQKAFGENYLQEALTKMHALQDTDIEWHFIGPIQKNKTRKIAEHFSWVHSVENIKIAKRLNEQRPFSLPPLNICIQVNIDQEETKSGIPPQDVLPLTQYILSECPQLILRGLMVIPRPTDTFEQQRLPFRKLRSLLNQINQTRVVNLDTLSMGMSSDYLAAIAEGATIIRLGTALFGERKVDTLG